jgi:antitoxin VapB
MTEGRSKTTAKLFMHGRSQAVRLPKEFRLPGKEARVSKVGDRVILEPMEKPKFDSAAFWAAIDALGGEDLFRDGGPDDPASKPDPRKFFDE